MVTLRSKVRYFHGSILYSNPVNKEWFMRHLRDKNLNFPQREINENDL